ncbi:hypothetical protein F2Q68_00017632 [Brassica cretica]|uniref:Uncharacterized protein n=1 Tax=Brassica cretica TaxID=69181 RepID=A0A8S9HH13_BRACR|nr:hypothetical protein F2Q68_00017632 [Brassica cretica]
MAAVLSSRFVKGIANLRCTRLASASGYQHGMMRSYSTTVPSESDTHDDFKPTQKVPSGSTASLKDIVENVNLELFGLMVCFEICIWLELFC